MKEFKVLAPFNGISCGRVALERANIPVERYVSYEIDDNANKIAQHNYPNDEYNGDVFEADFTQYKGFDLLMGGSPCNYWTIAKTNRETTSDGLGFKLFMQYVRALEESNPIYFIYENNQSISENIKSEITKYLKVEPIMINSSLLSAQNRRRLYWTNIPNVEQPKDLNITISDIVGEECYCVIKQPYLRKKIDGKYDRRYEPRLDGKSGTVVATNAGQSNMIMIKSDALNCNCKVENGIYYDYIEKKQYPIIIPDGNYFVRSLTVKEMEQLQTLPVGYTLIVNDSFAKKGIGNGWTVDVISHILSFIRE